MEMKPLNRLHQLVLEFTESGGATSQAKALQAYLGDPRANQDIQQLVEAVNASMDDRRPDQGLWAIQPLLILGSRGVFDPLFIANLHGALGSILMDAGRYAEAEAAAREGLRLQEENNAQPLVVAQSYGVLGSILRMAGRYAEAEAAARKGLRLQKENNAPLLVVAESYGALGSILMDAGRYAVAEAAAREGLRLQKENNAPLLVVAESYGALGSILRMAGRYAEAEAAARKGLRLQKENNAPLLVVAESYGALGSILMDAGRYTEAETAAREGLRLRRENSAPPPMVAESYGALGSILRAMGRYTEAETAAREGLRLRRENSAPPLVVAESYGALGSILMDAGRYAVAETAAREGLRIEQENNAPPLVVAHSYGALGSILRAAGRYAEAEAAARKGLRLQKENNAPLLVVAQSYGALGSILMDAGRYAEAETAAREGLRLRRENNAPPLVVAQSYASLGSILRAAGRYAEAEAAVRTENGKEAEADALAATAAEKYLQAADQLRQAIDLAVRFEGLGALPIKTSCLLAELAGDRGKRTRHYQAAITHLMEYALSLNSPEDHFRAIREYGNVFTDAIQWALDSEQRDLALEWVDRSRGLAFTLALAKQTAERDTAEQLRALQAKKSRAEAALAVDPASEDHLADLEQIASEQRAVIASERERVTAMTEAPLKRSDRSALIPAGTVYLAFQPLGDQVLVYALTSTEERLETQPVPVSLIMGGPNQGDVSLLVELRASGVPAQNERLAELRDQLLSPNIQALVRAANEVILSPGGGLGQLPFEAMTFDEERLDERCVVSRGSTVGVLQFIRRTPTTNETPSVLAVGLNDGNSPEEPYPEPTDEDIAGMNDPQRGEEAVLRAVPLTLGKIPRLRFAEKEARDVIALYGQGECRTGADARASEVRGKVRDTTVFSASVHGWSFHQDALRSSLLLQPLGETEGFLMAKDLLSHRDCQMELALLSACGSAGTDLLTGGEGVVGMPTAYIYAGVRTVIATIRPVRDGLAYQMVLAIHRQLRSGKSAHEALREVRREAMDGKFGSIGKRMWESQIFVVYGDPHMRLPAALLA